MEAPVKIPLTGYLVTLAIDIGATAAFAQTYDGPPNDRTRYWAVPAYPDLLPKGPAQAIGIIFWSHGVHGTQPQYQYPPIAIIRQLARD